MVKALAIDVGSTSIRAGIVDETGTVTHVHQEKFVVRNPQSGEVELDADEIARLAVELAKQSLELVGQVDAVGITNQRATSILFDTSTGSAIGPALSWQDLRTVLDCLILQGEGLRLAPNQSATKFRWLLQNTDRDITTLRCATIETWIAWHLSKGDVFVTDTSNAAVTGLINYDAATWNGDVLAKLGIPPETLPTIVDTIGHVGAASVLAGSPPITALVGDQSASLFGQSCVAGGAKITFGTGAMLDLVSGDTPPTTMQRLDSGCYPIIARSAQGQITWGIEGIVLNAGTCIEWLCELGLLNDPSESSDVARSVDSTDGVSFVPAFSGLGTPTWDFGARAGFFGLTRGTTKAHLVRAVLEGIAHRGADLVDAAESDLPAPLTEIRVDGGMSANAFFVQFLADVSGKNVAVSSEREATTRGVGLMALVGANLLSLDDVATLWSPSALITPSLSDDERIVARRAWRTITERVQGTIPELSTISF